MLKNMVKTSTFCCYKSKLSRYIWVVQLSENINCQISYTAITILINLVIK